MYRIMFKFIIYPIIMKVNMSYIKFLRNEQRKAQEYVDRLNEERNFAYENRNYNRNSFRSEWYEYEDEYHYNFCGLE